jgi:hypothetical protein
VVRGRWPSRARVGRLARAALASVVSLRRAVVRLRVDSTRPRLSRLLRGIALSIVPCFFRTGRANPDTRRASGLTIGPTPNRAVPPRSAKVGKQRPVPTVVRRSLPSPAVRAPCKGGRPSRAKQKPLALSLALLPCMRQRYDPSLVKRDPPSFSSRFLPPPGWRTCNPAPSSTAEPTHRLLPCLPLSPALLPCAPSSNASRSLALNVSAQRPPHCLPYQRQLLQNRNLTRKG